ncbi:hypothetical protein D1007_61604 [Hordeum vulgare]|nr:hypothetical protein D1007_61604 [Hordeum vulgare]
MCRFFFLELRARAALSSICLAVRSANYVMFSSKLVEELEGMALKVDDVLEDECRCLFSLAVTRVISHLLLHKPNFNFYELICPGLKDSRQDLPRVVESYVGALLGANSVCTPTIVNAWQRE